ncbi:MAG: methylated-DNA--[protein]-cysteine S-methyltransferase [Bacteroidia bacterium]|nr:methylated-DNA--[protein]-cysteine S-methyltransferase [Bacteroidia bacterium]
METAAIVSLYTTQILTPIGEMQACASDRGLCLLEFMERKNLAAELKQLQKLMNMEITEGTHPYLEQVQREMDEYFAGTRKQFDVPLHTPGTEFQQSVWKALLQIPYGVTRTYKEQSLILGNLPAIRAVAHANGMNRIAIIIPCHRVIGHNGNLTGYAGGIWRKKWLLEHEQPGKQCELFPG